MIEMIGLKLDLRQAHADLAALDKLLTDNEQLEETGPGGLQEFFTSHPHLLLLMSRAFCPGLLPAAYLPECSVVQEFRADYAVANEDRSKFLFVEFEHAKKDSIFATKVKTKANQSYQWAKTFEHGFSQVLDWYFRLDDYQRASKIEEHFGAPKIDYVGILVIGRDQFLKKTGLSQRFEWRRKYTVINSQHLHCFTFDELARELRGHYETLIDLAETV
jgi:hypothetical protein